MSDLYAYYYVGGSDVWQEATIRSIEENGDMNLVVNGSEEVRTMGLLRAAGRMRVGGWGGDCDDGGRCS
jgi:hypothetical protein